MERIVYIETTIPSFYFEVRTEPAMIAQRDSTRKWWRECRHNFLLATGSPVLEELGRGNHPNKTQALDLIRDLPKLAVTSRVKQVALAYVQHRLMPSDLEGDALHLALASVHGCDFLLTWNCAHLANESKRRHIEMINRRLNLSVPALKTPQQLLEETNETY